jgi:hypothetical protein
MNKIIFPPQDVPDTMAPSIMSSGAQFSIGKEMIRAFLGFGLIYIFLLSLWCFIHC